MIALNMIVKAGDDSEAKLLDACLGSIHEHVDAIYLQLNALKGNKISPKVRAVAEKYTSNIKVFEWTGNFAKARNTNLAQVSKKYDWVLWLDTDDTVENPEKIKDAIAIAPKSIGSIYVQYDYAHDEWGNVTVSHWTSRIFRNNGGTQWKSSIDDAEVSVHETPVPVRATAYGTSDEFKVIHHDTLARRAQSHIRNIQLLEGMFERQSKSGTDPRILFYLGREYYNSGRIDEASDMFYEYLKTSGWGEERAEANVFMGHIFNSYKMPVQARIAFLQALGENNGNIQAYIELAKLDFKGQRYHLATTWLREASEIKQGPQAMDLFTDHYELYMLLAESLAEQGGKHLTEALEWAEKGLKMRPLDPTAQDRRDKISFIVDYQKDMKAVARLVRSLRKDEKDKIPTFIDSLPNNLADSPVVMGARLEFNKPKVWPKKSIAIFCGGSPLGIWGPWSLKEGIGGSEEAVIRLSRELCNVGWEVTIYATPGDRTGTDFGFGLVPILDGGAEKRPEWKQYWEFNPEDEFDVLVAWRMPAFFDNSYKARKKYLWLHDVMEKAEFTDERIKNLDKVIVLSRYHRSLFPMLPEEKVFLSANGITASDFEGVTGRRDPHRIIYMSSHIRGLALLYDIWPDVRKAVPGAKLDIYYGWQSYEDMNHNNPGNQPGGMAWMHMMQEWVKKLDGVTDHGKIGQQQIVEEIFKSGVWAYPCPFPEIYCITARKAQAGGAMPVSSDFAALDETVEFGVKIHMKQQSEDTPVGKWDKAEIAKYRNALIDALKNPMSDKERNVMMKTIREKCSWAGVAAQWSEEMK